MDLVPSILEGPFRPPEQHRTGVLRTWTKILITSALLSSIGITMALLF